MSLVLMDTVHLSSCSVGTSGLVCHLYPRRTHLLISSRQPHLRILQIRIDRNIPYLSFRQVSKCIFKLLSLLPGEAQASLSPCNQTCFHISSMSTTVFLLVPEVFFAQLSLLLLHLPLPFLRLGFHLLFLCCSERLQSRVTSSAVQISLSPILSTCSKPLKISLTASPQKTVSKNGCEHRLPLLQPRPPSHL